MNAYCKLEELCGNVQEPLNGLLKGSIRSTRQILLSCLAYEDEELTLVDVGKMIDHTNLKAIRSNLLQLVGASIPEPKEEDKVKNE
jgi:hypothetical protein